MEKGIHDRLACNCRACTSIKECPFLLYAVCSTCENRNESRLIGYPTYGFTNGKPASAETEIKIAGSPYPGYGVRRAAGGGAGVRTSK